MDKFDKIEKIPPIGGLLRSVPYSFNDDLTAIEFCQTVYKYLESLNKLTDEMRKYLNGFIEKFDDNLHKTVSDVLKTWLNDGTLNHIITDEVLEDFKERLNLKMDKTGLIYPANLSKEVKELLTDGKVAVVGGDSVYTDSIVKNAVNRDKINFYSENISSNLFDKNTAKYGGYFNDTDYTWLENKDYCSFNVPVLPQTNYYIYTVGARMVLFRKGTKVLSSVRTNTGDIKRVVFTPTDCDNIICSVAVNEINNFCFNKGETLMYSLPQYNDTGLALTDENFSGQFKHGFDRPKGKAHILFNTNINVEPLFNWKGNTVTFVENIWLVDTNLRSFVMNGDFPRVVDLGTENVGYIFYNVISYEITVLNTSEFFNKKTSSDDVYLGYFNKSFMTSDITGELTETRHESASILGDSISTYKGWLPEGNRTFYDEKIISNVRYTWWYEIFHSWYRLNTNNSWSGATVATTNTAEKSNAMDRVDKLQTGDEKPTTIVIFLGTNDFFRNVKLGEFTGVIDDDNEKEFSNTYAKMLREVYKNYYPCKVVCIGLPFLSTTTGGMPPVNSNGNTPLDFNKSIKNICEQFNTPYVDFWNIGRSSHNAGLSGGTHPSASGHYFYKKAFKRQVDRW